jgi:hypothetical protein
LPSPDGDLDTGPSGPWVLPGDYQVRLRLGDQEQTKGFQIEGDPAVDISPSDRAAWHDTLVRLHGMIGVSHAVTTTLSQLQVQVGQIREILAARSEPDAALGARLDDVEVKLRAIVEEMEGADTGGGATQPGAPPLARQIRQLYSAIGASTALPTADQIRLSERSRELLSAQVDSVNRLLEVDLPQLEEQLDQAGIPWTPGRRIAPVRWGP